MLYKNLSGFVSYCSTLRSWYTKEVRAMSATEWFLASTMFCVVALATTTAWSTGGASIALAITVIATTLLAGYRIELVTNTVLYYGGITCLTVMVASSIWSYETYSSIRAIGIFLAILGGLVLVQAAFQAMPQGWLVHLGRAASISFLIFLLYALIEETSNHQLKRILFWPFQAISIENFSLRVNWDHISQVRPHRTNWNMTTLSLLLWPVLILVTRDLDRSKARTIEVVLCLALLVTVLQSEHQTAMFALVVGYIVYSLARLIFTATIKILAFSWILMFLFAIPVAHALYDLELHKTDYLPSSFEHRIVIWKYTADRIPDKPIFGVGIGATRPLDNARQSELKPAAGTRYMLQTGSHPHNIYLQIWYELGIVGVLCIGIYGLLVLNTIACCAPGVRAHYCGAFAVVQVTSLASFGWYETWYASAVALCCVLFILESKTAVHLAAPREKLPTSSWF